VHVNVSVAVLINNNRQVLLGQRPHPKSWEGWWEFPGGKIEKGETSVDALYREIDEEIGVKITQFKKWVIRKYSHGGNDITLHFFKVYGWEGEVTSKENQKLVWTHLQNPNVSPILPANLFIQKAFDLPKYYAITNLSETSKKVFFNQLQNRISNGLKMIQVREKNISFDEFKIFSNEVIKICKPKGVKVIINSDVNLAYEIKADGVHLRSKDLISIKKIPKNLIVSASCHTQEEIYIAEKLNINFLVLSAIKKTLSHPDIKPIGWDEFEKIVNRVNTPIYALGGLGVNDYSVALENGAIGIASQRSIWQ
jgi:8-oxo-dGTP diphosphatase|tara:strand:+ start:1676 stop:2605 length:930 start_codon:yes stop_codon:yes gene_type:complete